MKPVIGISTDLEQPEGDKNHWHQTLDLDYVHLIEKNGMIPLLLPFTEGDNIEREIMDRIDGLLISGGKDIHPRFYGEAIQETLDLTPHLRVNYDLKLVRKALNEDKPLLAICYGLQLLNVAQGGTIYQDMAQVKDALPHREGKHLIHLQKGTKLLGIFQLDSIEVSSSHHQSIREVGENLKVSATSSDGVIEAIEHKEAKFALGLQWHVEKKADKFSRRMMEAFREACLNYDKA